MVKSVSWPTAEITGNARGDDGAGDSFFIEGPQVFQRAAAASHDDEVGPIGSAEVFEAGADLLAGAFALHEGGENANVQSREAALEDLQHVANHGAGG